VAKINSNSAIEAALIEKHKIDFIKFVYASLEPRHVLIEQIHT